MEYYGRFFSKHSSDYSKILIILIILERKYQLNANMSAIIYSSTFHFEIIKESQNSRYREVPCILHPVSPEGYILHNYRTISKLGKSYYYKVCS